MMYIYLTYGGEQYYGAKIFTHIQGKGGLWKSIEDFVADDCGGLRRLMSRVREWVEHCLALDWDETIPGMLGGEMTFKAKSWAEFYPSEMRRDIDHYEEQEALEREFQEQEHEAEHGDEPEDMI